MAQVASERAGRVSLLCLTRKTVLSKENCFRRSEGRGPERGRKTVAPRENESSVAGLILCPGTVRYHPEGPRADRKSISCVRNLKGSAVGLARFNHTCLKCKEGLSLTPFFSLPTRRPPTFQALVSLLSSQIHVWICTR